MDYPRLYGVPLQNLDEARLLHSDLHWKRGRSAFETSNAWIAARGIPSKVAATLAQAPEWAGAELLAGFFEHGTALDTQIGPSYTDLLTLCGLPDGLAVLAVEGKAGEPFGQLVSEWKTSPGGEARFFWACEMFAVEPVAASVLRWQLFHRTASAVLEAKRFRGRHAMTLVHDFSVAASSAPDFIVFAAAIGIEGAGVNGVSEPKVFDGVSVRLAWVCDDCAKEQA